MAENLIDSEAIGASFSTSINGLLKSISMARMGIEDRDTVIDDLQEKLAIQDKTVSDLQAKVASQEKDVRDLQDKNKNLSSYLTLLNQTMEFLISTQLPVHSSKYKALNHNFQVDCVICNEQRLVLWKLLPAPSAKKTSTPSDGLLVRVMKHFAGKGVPSFGPVTARVDSIDVGASEAGSELGKRRRGSIDFSTAMVAGITTDNRTVVPTTVSTTAPSAARSVIPAISAAMTHSTVGNTATTAKSASKYSVSSVTANSLATHATNSVSNPHTHVALSVNTSSMVGSAAWPNTLSSKSNIAVPCVRPLPLNSSTTTSMPPPKKALHTTHQPLPKASGTSVAAAMRKDVPALVPGTPGPGPGPLSRLDTAVAVSSVLNLQSGTKEMVRWLRESQQAAQTSGNPAIYNTALTSAFATTQPTASASSALSAANEAFSKKKRKSSVQPLPLSDLLNVATSSAKAPPVVLDMTGNSTTAVGPTVASAVPVRPPAPVAGASVPPVPPVTPQTLPVVPIASSAGPANDITNVPSAASLPKAAQSNVTTVPNHSASATKASADSVVPSPTTNSAQKSSTPSKKQVSSEHSVTTTATDTTTSASTFHLTFESLAASGTAEDPIIGPITVLPSNKPALPWHNETDRNLRPLIIKSMVMKHKDYAQHKHEPAWVASRRKGCEIFEAMQYYNCSSRKEYMAQAGVNVC